MSKYLNELHLNPYNAHGKIVDLVAPGSSILDVGCSKGVYSGYLIEKKSCTVTGIDACREDLNFAKEKGLNVLQCNLNDINSLMNLDFGKDFDFIILADILEHLLNPEKLIKSLLLYLKPGGKLIISVPNIANWNIRFKLLFGRFDYTERGILDSTHIKFFTLNSFARFLKEICSLGIIKIDYTSGVDELKFFRRTVDRFLRKFPCRDNCLSKLTKFWPSLFAMQFIALCEKSE